jgi:hypothetical protein
MKQLSLSVLLALAGLAASLTLGCGSPQMTDPAQLSDVLRSFHQDQRWANWAGAAKWLSPEMAPRWLAARSQKNQVQITDINVVQVNPGTDPEVEAIATVRVEYYVMPAMRLEASTWRQQWRKTDGAWRLMSEERAAVEAPKPVDNVPSWP